MEDTFLTSDEIYAIEDMSEESLLDFIAFFTPAKKELATHVFSKNRSIRALEFLACERDEHNQRLVKLLETNGIGMDG